MFFLSTEEPACRWLQLDIQSSGLVHLHTKNILLNLMDYKKNVGRFLELWKNVRKFLISVPA